MVPYTTLFFVMYPLWAGRKRNHWIASCVWYKQGRSYYWFTPPRERFLWNMIHRKRGLDTRNKDLMSTGWYGGTLTWFHVAETTAAQTLLQLGLWPYGAYSYQHFSVRFDARSTQCLINVQCLYWLSQCLVLSWCFVLRTTMNLSPGLCLFVLNCIWCIFVCIRHLFDTI